MKLQIGLPFMPSKLIEQKSTLVYRIRMDNGLNYYTKCYIDESALRDNAFSFYDLNDNKIILNTRFIYTITMHNALYLHIKNEGNNAFDDEMKCFYIAPIGHTIELIDNVYKPNLEIYQFTLDN